MDSYITLLILCCLVVLSYVFDFIAIKTRFPSVVLLMGVGIAARLLLPENNFAAYISPLLQLLGTVGLILIVLEGGLDIKITGQKRGLIIRSLLAAFIILLATAFALAGVIYALDGAPFYTCFVNAVPLSVISSSIAIPSAVTLSPHNKEFVVYESTFSDILGIILFNFVTVNDAINGPAFGGLFIDIVLVTVLSAVFSLLLFKMVETITHKVKFFLILALLIIMYTLGKNILHLPTLLLVFAFGLLMGNHDLLLIQPIKKYFNTDDFDTHFREFFLITAESAFIIRTFFFVAFGFSVPLETLGHSPVLLVGILAFFAILVVRFVYMRISRTGPVNILSLIAPRGLITILLFLQLPAKYQVPGVGLGVVFIVICLSLVALTVGTMITGKNKSAEQPVNAGDDVL